MIMQIFGTTEDVYEKYQGIDNCDVNIENEYYKNNKNYEDYNHTEQNKFNDSKNEAQHNQNNIMCQTKLKIMTSMTVIMKKMIISLT